MGTGSITLTNLAGYNLGVPSAEAGINVQKVSVKASAEKVEVKDRLGHIIGRVDHSLKQEYTIEGYINGVTGITSEMIGALTTVASANTIGMGTLTPGAFILEDIQRDDETMTLSKLTYKVSHYPDIPSTATQTNL